MAKWTAAARKAYYKSNPENFAGEGDSYPIKDGSDVGDAWGLAGHAPDPDAVRTKIKSIAKRLGLEASLPDTAKDDEERSMTAQGALNRAAMPPNHDPFSGSHTHAHPAMGDQGDDASHEHSHSHDGDNNHEHDHAERAAASHALAMHMPITRIDKDAWLIEGQATSDQVDYYNTVFDYESSKKAFQSWRGNIREMHRNVAVGKAVEIDFDDVNRCVLLRARISKGAKDTWEKILDGTLSGFSIGVPPGRFKETIVTRNGKSVPMYHDFELAEVSVVDSPGSPGCNIALVRADGMTTEALDDTEDTENTPSVPSSSPSESESALHRAGARVSGDTRSAMHDAIGHTLMGAMSQMKNCGCDCCNAAMQMIDPDQDGDVDLGGYMDPDNDWQALYPGGVPAMDDEVERKLSAMLERVLEAKLSVVYARLQGIAGGLARSMPTTSAQIDTLVTSAITRAVESVSAEQKSNLDGVRADLSAVKGQVEKIAATPVPGAPMMHSGSLPRAADKTLATDPYRLPPSRGATADAVAALFNAGQLDTTEKQVDAVAAALMAQRRGK